MGTTQTTHMTPAVMSADEGEALWSVGALMLLKADAEQTDGAFTLVDHTAPPGYETPYHVHRREDEVFYVLEGEIDCYHGEDAENVARAGPGDTVFLPRDIPHGFRVAGDDACRMLVQVTPAGVEELFREVGTPAERLETPPPAELDAEALTEAAAEYDLEILGPIPA
ncbi:Cupin domain protein [Natronoarchaeum philippinense]|uniref:Cupin domain protein n=1 Tax=Natronoarchaeum philippinense TaxID=558529 RepID=A0A285P0K4_NATPI|nr:quercetin 2,3-dioxygenase [Natronoarchaeum philippinense]SNZ15260.1 Cupin domain protein [Natronoarchaeum philippinense]